MLERLDLVDISIYLFFAAKVFQQIVGMSSWTKLRICPSWHLSVFMWSGTHAVTGLKNEKPPVRFFDQYNYYPEGVREENIVMWLKQLFQFRIRDKTMVAMDTSKSNTKAIKTLNHPLRKRGETRRPVVMNASYSKRKAITTLMHPLRIRG